MFVIAPLGFLTDTVMYLYCFVVSNERIFSVAAELSRPETCKAGRAAGETAEPASSIPKTVAPGLKQSFGKDTWLEPASNIRNLSLVTESPREVPPYTRQGLHFIQPPQAILKKLLSCLLRCISSAPDSAFLGV